MTASRKHLVSFIYTVIIFILFVETTIISLIIISNFDVLEDKISSHTNILGETSHANNEENSGISEKQISGTNRNSTKTQQADSSNDKDDYNSTESIKNEDSQNIEKENDNKKENIKPQQEPELIVEAICKNKKTAIAVTIENHDGSELRFVLRGYDVSVDGRDLLYSATTTAGEFTFTKQFSTFFGTYTDIKLNTHYTIEIEKNGQVILEDDVTTLSLCTTTPFGTINSKDNVSSGRYFNVKYNFYSPKKYTEYYIEVSGGSARLPSWYYDFDGGYCRLVGGSPSSKTWKCVFTEDVDYFYLWTEIKAEVDPGGVPQEKIYIRITSSNSLINASKTVDIL